MTVINDAPEDCQHKSLLWLTHLLKTFNFKIICISIESSCVRFLVFSRRDIHEYRVPYKHTMESLGVLYLLKKALG
jgi:hypothetical protein